MCFVDHASWIKKEHLGWWLDGLLMRKSFISFMWLNDIFLLFQKACVLPSFSINLCLFKGHEVNVYSIFFFYLWLWIERPLLMEMSPLVTMAFPPPLFEHDRHRRSFLVHAWICTQYVLVMVVWPCTSLVACICIGACIFFSIGDVIFFSLCGALINHARTFG